MDIKDLNKAQLILLAVLLSFVTSLATGITTVTLMQQAPASFTTPINRVVRQTIEKIQQVEGKTTTQTVVVKEEDLVVDAIAQNKSFIFSILKDSDNNGLDTALSSGQGFIVNTSGVIVADAQWVSNKDRYYVKNDLGIFKAEFMYADDAGFSFLKITEVVDGKSVAPTTVPIAGDIEKMKTGQKILVLGNSISSFIYEGDKNLKINVTVANAGGMVLNLDGEALGIALSSPNSSFASINMINASLTAHQ